MPHIFGFTIVALLEPKIRIVLCIDIYLFLFSGCLCLRNFLNRKIECWRVGSSPPLTHSCVLFVHSINLACNAPDALLSSSRDKSRHALGSQNMWLVPTGKMHLKKNQTNSL